MSLLCAQVSREPYLEPADAKGVQATLGSYGAVAADAGKSAVRVAPANKKPLIAVAAAAAAACVTLLLLKRRQEVQAARSGLLRHELAQLVVRPFGSFSIHSDPMPAR